MAEELHAVMKGSQPAPAFTVTMERLEVEHDNLRAALTFVHDRHDPDLAVRLSRALWMFWLTRGHVSEWRHWLERAVARDAAATAARAEAFHGAGILASHQSNYDRAEELTQESYRLFDQLGDKQGIGFTLSSLGILAADQGDFDQAKPLLEAALTVAREIGHKAGIVNTLTNLAGVLSNLGELERAEAHLEEALEPADAIDDVAGTAYVLFNLGELAFRRGEPDRAAMWYRQSLLRWRGSGEQWGFATNLFALALALADGQPARAARLFGAEEATRETSGIRREPIYQTRFEQALADLRAALGEEALAAFWAAGRALSVEEAMAEALAVADEEAMAKSS